MDFDPTAMPLCLATGTIHRHAVLDLAFRSFVVHA